MAQQAAAVVPEGRFLRLFRRCSLLGSELAQRRNPGL
jgi:hypothetical protein